MTTGRINQVAILHDAGDRARTARLQPGGWDRGRERARQSCYRETQAHYGQIWRGTAVPPPAWCSASGSATVGPCTRAAANGIARGTGNGVRSAPSRREGEGARGETIITKISQMGTQHRNPCISPRRGSKPLGYENRGDRRPTVRRSSADPASPFDPITAHAQSRTQKRQPHRA